MLVPMLHRKTLKYIQKMKYETLPYSPDFVPTFLCVSAPLKMHKFRDDADIQNAEHKLLHSLENPFF